VRRIVIAGLLYGALAAAHAETAAPPLVSNERLGYAFEFPRVLAEQRLFGIAHGVSLLATACLDAPDEADAVADAYTQWYEQQQDQIEMLKSELAEFYFGPRAGEASWSHVAATLKLRQAIGLEPGSEKLRAACASLPEALRQPRYDLTALFQLEAALAGMRTAARAEAQAEACSTRLPEAERPALAAHYASWQQREADAIASARAQMLQQWQNTATPGDPDEWQKAVRKRYANPPALACEQLPEWLDGSASSLAQSFASAPALGPVAADSTEALDNTVTAITSPPLESISAIPAEPTVSEGTTAAPPAEAKSPNLFDYLMKLFDERPHEDAAQPAE